MLVPIRAASARKLSILNALVQGLALRSVFQQMDTSGDGELNFDEWEDGCNRIGVVLTDAMSRELFSSFDTDNSGAIDFAEFSEALAKHKVVISRRLAEKRRELIAMGRNALKKVAQEADVPEIEIELFDEGDVPTKDFVELVLKAQKSASKERELRARARLQTATCWQCKGSMLATASHNKNTMCMCKYKNKRLFRGRWCGARDRACCQAERRQPQTLLNLWG